MINVTKTHLPDINKYKSYIDKIYESGWLTNNGELLNILEKRLKEYLGVKNIILVSNGTIALQIAYKLLDLKGEVITTPFSFVATTSSLVWEGLTPVFCDIDCETYTIDTNKIESLITENTSAIVPVHVFGNGCDVEKINDIAKKYNLKVIYDAAHTFGVKYKDNSILNHGDISTLSFHSTKLFHTIEGGAIIINDDALYEKAKRIINFGIDMGEIHSLGINAKMNEFQAAMGLCMLDEVDNILKDREKVYKDYFKELNKIPYITLQKVNQNCNMNYSYLPILIDTEKKLLKIVEKLNNNDIYPRRYFYPSLDTLPYLSNGNISEISRDISNRILCLPMYETLEDKDLENIIKILKANI